MERLVRLAGRRVARVVAVATRALDAGVGVWRWPAGDAFCYGHLWVTLAELWAWQKPAKDLTHRDDSPWDDAARRPSHADRRKALQAECLAAELSHTLSAGQISNKVRNTLKRLLRITV